MVDLVALHAPLQLEIEAAVQGVLASGSYILGPNVAAFEREVAACLDVPHAVGCASGTDALQLALRALGVGPGDEVITSPFTFIATAEAIAYTGARPVFADIDPHSLNLDPAAVEAAITPRTRAVLPVHLYGGAADLDSLLEIARRHKLWLIEDAAQAFGAEWRGRKLGGWGDVGCFSFYPSKNLGAMGDGGLVVTRDEAVAARLRLLREHGHTGRYRHASIGLNSRLDEVQAAILRVKLPYVDRHNEARRRVARTYAERLGDLELALPHEDARGRHVFHQYTLRTAARDALQQALAAAGVASNVYYPVPIHLQESFRAQCPGVYLPEAEAAAAEVISLPVHPMLETSDVEAVCAVVQGVVPERVRSPGPALSRVGYSPRKSQAVLKP